MNLLLKTIVNEPLETNNYLLISQKTKKAVLFDVGDHIDGIFDILQSHEASLEAVIYTHGHFDHIFGGGKLAERGVKTFYIHPKDEPLLGHFENACALYGFKKTLKPFCTHMLQDEAVLQFDDIRIQVLHTPGHSPGSCSFLTEVWLISGDTLFCESVGRADLPGGNFSTLANSISQKLYCLPKETVVYPGHGPTTTIGHEQEYNPYVSKNFCP